MDAQLHQADWRSADSIVTLTQVVPLEAAPTTARKVTRVLVQVDVLILGIPADDPDPAGITSFTKERYADLEREDHIRLELDTFRDGRSGFVFAVNPSGARYHALVSNRGESENPTWDAVW